MTIPADALTMLSTADVSVEGRMPWSSNATFLVRLHLEGDDPAAPREHLGIYKPVRGERPLWDFEPGLHRRELAAYRLSEAMGIGAVPPTVIRTDAPFGEGSIQWFVTADHAEHYFTIYEQRPELHAQLQDIAVFDVVANNTDRKSGHCLIEGDRVWAIDHGLCFSQEFKLRTVIWEFAAEALSPRQVAAVRGLAECLPADVADLLSKAETDAMRQRAGWLAEHRVLPGDDSGHRYPWPLV